MPSQPVLLPDFTVFDCNVLKADLAAQQLFAFQLYGMWRALVSLPPVDCPVGSFESCLRGIGDDSFAAYSQFFTHSFETCAHLKASSVLSFGQSLLPQLIQATSDVQEMGDSLAVPLASLRNLTAAFVPIRTAGETAALSLEQSLGLLRPAAADLAASVRQVKAEAALMHAETEALLENQSQARAALQRDLGHLEAEASAALQSGAQLAEEQARFVAEQQQLLDRSSALLAQTQELQRLQGSVADMLAGSRFAVLLRWLGWHSAALVGLLALLRFPHASLPGLLLLLCLHCMVQGAAYPDWQPWASQLAALGVLALLLFGAAASSVAC